MKFIKVFRTDRLYCEYFSINLIKEVHIWKGEVKAHGEILFSNDRHFWFKVSDFDISYQDFDEFFSNPDVKIISLNITETPE